MDAHRSQSPHLAGREADGAHPRRAARVRRWTTGLLLAGGLALALVGCAGESGTEITPSASQLIRVSAEADTVRVGEQTDPPLAVRVENGLGEPLEGVPVRFLVASGPGAVVPSNVAVSNEQGIAEAAFVAGSEFGRSRVRVDVPSASNVSPLSFSVVTLPAREVTLRAQEGDGQQAEVRSQLPLPFSLRVETPAGTPAGGVPVVWEIVDGAPGAALSADTTFTGPDGETGTLLTLGDEPVDHAVRAFAGDGVVTDTARFSAAALVVLDGPARIDSVAPTPLRAGEEATLFGDGFGQRTENVEVRVEGVAAEATEVTGGSVRFRVPSFADRCLPTRRVGVRALVRGEPSNGSFAVLHPASELAAMEVGEVRSVTGPDAAGCVVLSAVPDAAEYLVVAGSAARDGTGTTPYRMLLTTAEPTEDEEQASIGTASARPSPERSVLEAAHPAARVRESALGALRERGFMRGESSVRLVRTAAPAAARVGAAEVREGDTLRFRFAVGQDLQVACEDTSRIVAAVVRHAGSRTLVAEDVEAPSGGFTPTMWDELGRVYDEIVVPTDSAYFGAPADIDGNGRVTYLFTPQVNRLTPPNSPSFLAGFFLPLDLVDSGDPEGSGLAGEDGQICPASNEGELIYMASADPEGRFGATVRVDQALRQARSIGAHELEHLISAEQRLVVREGGFADLGVTWLQEGLAHLAEEVVGLRLMEAERGQNLTWEEVSSDRERIELFNTYHLNNFARLSFYMRAPVATPALAEQEPGGLASLQMRGFAWAFVRWLADRDPEADDAALTRALSTGGSGAARGVANVEQAVGGSWESLVSEFQSAVALDDAGLPGEAGNRGFTTWDLRSVFAGLNRNAVAGSSFPLAFPLAETVVPFESTAVEFEARAATAGYVRLQDTRGGRGLAIRLGSQTGGLAPASSVPTLTVVRTR